MGEKMETLIMIISILLTTIVLLQSGKAEGSSMLGGSGSELFSNRKERGSELFITRLTVVLGTAFMIICLYMTF